MEAVRWIVTASFAVLAAVGLRLWWRSRREPARWLAWLFAGLGVALVVNRLLPEQPVGVLAAVDTGIAAVIVVLPYLLFRFAESFEPIDGRRRSLVTAAVVVTAAATVVALAWTSTGPEPDWYPLFVVGVLLVWTGLTAWVVWRLWSAGRLQPGLTQRRLRAMALAAGLLNAALLIAGLGEGEGFAAAAQLTAFAAAVAFMLASSPPRWLRVLWRQADERALWEAEDVLVAAQSRDEVISAVLPHVATLLGGAGALFVDRDGHETSAGLNRMSRDTVRTMLDTATGSRMRPVVRHGVATMVLRQGRLGVVTSPYTLLFGEDELELFERLGALLDLALARVEASLTTGMLEALERGLLPVMDPPPGLIVESRYRAGLARMKLGGDFMDVVTLPDDGAAFVIGDVSGHGPAEAAFAVGVHAGWRTVANADPRNPSGWFALLDETFFDENPERFVTALAGRADISARTVTMSSAGHHPPVVVGRHPRPADVPPDLLLGLAHAERRKEHTITLSEDEALLLYTDGLLEQPRPSDRRLRWSEDDLLAWLRERPTVADIDLDALLWDFGRDAFEDDVAVMLLAFAPRG